MQNYDQGMVKIRPRTVLEKIETTDSNKQQYKEKSMPVTPKISLRPVI